MKNIRIIILAILLTFLSCDIFYHVQINGSYTTEIKLECGIVELECHTLGKMKYIMTQTFNINVPVYIHTKNIRISHNGELIDLKMSIAGRSLLSDQIVKIDSLDILAVQYYVDCQVSDTLYLNMDNFIECDNNFIRMPDDIFLTARSLKR